MIKKILKGLALGLSVLTALSVTACGPTFVPNENGSKTKIYLMLYGGGHGTEYIDYIIESFMAEHPDYDEKFYIDYDAKKMTPSAIHDELQAGYSETQMYIMAQNNFAHFIYSDYLEDLSDVALMKPDGEDGLTVKDKMVAYDEWQSIYSRYGEGLYALPYADSVMGFVYDHQLFVDNNWYTFATEANDGAALTEQGISYTERAGKLLFSSATGKVNYKAGDKILTAGKDGKYGTYDDGQPKNETDWDNMIKKISATGTKAFISAGGVGSYAQHIISALFGQIGGIEEWNTYFTYDSNGETVKLSDGEEIVFTLENGYRVNEMDSLYKAYEWIAKYFDSRNDDPLVSLHPTLSDSTKNHLDAQNMFLLGYQKAQTNPQSAMLLEGAWWEYEARSMFNTLGNLDESRGYGKKEYRYMLLPDIEGQKNGKSVISACESGAIIVPKDTNKQRLQVTKDFLAYLASDKALNHFLCTTGSIMPYQYNLTEEDYAKMTPFTKNMIELYSDSENVDIVRPQIATLWEPISYAGDRPTIYFIPEINGIQIDAPFKAVREKSLNDIKTGLSKLFKQKSWAEYIAAAKKQGFYNENGN